MQARDTSAGGVADSGWWERDGKLVPKLLPIGDQRTDLVALVVE